MTGNDERDVLELRDVSVTLDATPVLRNVDFALAPGELHCLTGPNGSGKTTLLSVLLGLRRPTAGTVERSGTVGCSFQEPNVYPDLSVAENLHVFASPAEAGQEWRERVRREFGLDAVADRRTDRLSGGYRRRLDLALAFVRRPTFVLLDEPLDELDDHVSERVLAFIEEYCADGHGVLVATHDATAYEPIIDRLTTLSEGRIVDEA